MIQHSTIKSNTFKGIFSIFKEMHEIKGNSFTVKINPFICLKFKSDLINFEIFQDLWLIFQKITSK